MMGNKQKSYVTPAPQRNRVFSGMTMVSLSIHLMFTENLRENKNLDICVTDIYACAIAVVNASAANSALDTPVLPQPPRNYLHDGASIQTVRVRL